MHVPLRAHCVDVQDGRIVRRFERHVGWLYRHRCAPRLRPAGAWFAGERDQRDLALAGRDRLRRMIHMHDIRRAAGFRRVGVAHVQAEVVGHREGAEARRVAGAEIRVDVREAEPGVGEGAARDFGVELGDGDPFGLARGMFVNACDTGLAINTQSEIPWSGSAA